MFYVEISMAKIAYGFANAFLSGRSLNIKLGWLRLYYSGAYFCFTYKEEKDNLFPLGVFGGIGYLLLFYQFVIGESILSLKLDSQKKK